MVCLARSTKGNVCGVEMKQHLLRKENGRQRPKASGERLTAAPLSIVAANRVLESTRFRGAIGFGDACADEVFEAVVRAGGWAPPKVQESTAGSYEARAVGSR